MNRREGKERLIALADFAQDVRGYLRQIRARAGFCLSARAKEVPSWPLSRSWGASQLLALDFNEVEDPHGITEDVARRKFIVDAQYESGVYIDIEEPGHIDEALPILNKAREAARV